MTDITPVIGIILSLLSALLTAFVIPYVRARLSAERLEQVDELVNIAVRAAEQLNAKPGSGEEKKNYVLDFLRRRGVTYDPEAVDAMIEAAVKNLNLDQGK